MPAITQSVVDQGVVLVYFRATGQTGPYFALPYSAAGVTISLSNYGVGFITINSSQNETGLDLRVVVINGTSLTTLALRHPGMDLNDYSQVAAALNLGH